MSPVMKATIFSVHPVSKKMRAPQTASRLRRISPFLLLVIFLIGWFSYILITDADAITPTEIVLLPFVVVNMILVDFAVWNYFGWKKKWLIWLIESIVSGLTIYLFI